MRLAKSIKSLDNEPAFNIRNLFFVCSYTLNREQFAEMPTRNGRNHASEAREDKTQASYSNLNRHSALITRGHDFPAAKVKIKYKLRDRSVL